MNNSIYIAHNKPQFFIKGLRFLLFCGIIVIEKDNRRDSMAGTLIMMMGIQGSGKSTFCRLFLTDEYERVDTLDQAISAICGGTDIIFDAINGSCTQRAACISAAKSAGCRVIGYYLDRAAEDCVASSKVPREQIYSALDAFEMPELDEGYDELYRVENDGEIMAICPWGEENDELFDFDFT